MATASVPDIELNPRKAVVVGNFARNLETAAGLVAQVQWFAGSHLDAKATSIIIVGNAKEFLPELKRKYPQVEVIQMEQLDLNSALLRKKEPAGP